MRSSTKISFSVEGELDEGELGAIRRVMEQAAALAEDFFAGDLEGAFAAAQALEVDPAELARVGLRVRLREELSWAQYGPSTSVPVQAAAPPPAPAEPVAPVVEAGEPAPVESAPMVPEEEPARPDGPFAAIAAFLARLRETFELAARNAEDAAPAPETAADVPTVEGSLKLRIFQSVLLTVRSSRVEEHTSELPRLVSQTLDAVDAHVRPPVDEVA